MTKQYQLTPVELELMEILWKLGEGTVHDVIAKLPKNRDLAYTSVSTILRILEQKNILLIQKSGRKHIYKPAFNKEIYAKHSVKKVVEKIFAGNSLELVSQLLNKEGLTVDELHAIQKLLDAKKRELKVC